MSLAHPEEVATSLICRSFCASVSDTRSLLWPTNKPRFLEATEAASFLEMLGPSKVAGAIPCTQKLMVWVYNASNLHEIDSGCKIWERRLEIECTCFGCGDFSPSRQLLGIAK